MNLSKSVTTWYQATRAYSKHNTPLVGLPKSLESFEGCYTLVWACHCGFTQKETAPTFDLWAAALYRKHTEDGLHEQSCSLRMQHHRTISYLLEIPQTTLPRERCCVKTFGWDTCTEARVYAHASHSLSGSKVCWSTTVHYLQLVSGISKHWRLGLAIWYFLLLRWSLKLEGTVGFDCAGGLFDIYLLDFFLIVSLFDDTIRC